MTEAQSRYVHGKINGKRITGTIYLPQRLSARVRDGSPPLHSSFRLRPLSVGRALLSIAGACNRQEDDVLRVQSLRDPGVKRADGLGG
jgi:hypothetical protein